MSKFAGVPQATMKACAKFSTPPWRKLILQSPVVKGSSENSADVAEDLDIILVFKSVITQGAVKTTLPTLAKSLVSFQRSHSRSICSHAFQREISEFQCPHASRDAPNSCKLRIVQKGQKSC